MVKNEIIKPSILAGFMELLPQDQLLFNKFIDTIKQTYESFGFVPLDTPIIEKAEIINSKGGDETEKQLYAFKKGDNELALRFDLTVPLARYVAQHYNDLHFPFRRYQIGKVFRGEKPQHGRFREFYQCDVDIIGNGDLGFYSDAEVLAVVNNLFSKLNFGKYLIRINNRKILTGFIQSLELKQKEVEFLRLIDKLEKIGVDKVSEGLVELGLDSHKINQVFKLFSIKGTYIEIINSLENLSISNETFVKGLSELKEVCKYINDLKIPQEVWTIDLTIARGLEYYTSTVYETVLVDYPHLGSVCSGGRYDNLAENFIDKKLPGVGISLGLTRLFFQLQELGVVKGNSYTPSQILVISMGDTFDNCLEYSAFLRENGIKCEVYTEQSIQFRKKLEYANKIGVPFVAIIGADEVTNKVVTVKNMVSGEQVSVSFNESLNVLGL